MKRRATAFRHPACRFAAAGVAATPLAGCQGGQSAFAPASADAARLLDLTWLLVGGATVIFLGVMLLLAVVLWGPSQWRARLARHRLVTLGGFVFPAVTLTFLLGWGLWLVRHTNAPGGTDRLTIRVTGEQYWWRVRYEQDGREPAFMTANELRLPVGRPVLLLLDSADVVHALWMPNLAGKLDMTPGRQTALHFTPSRTGIFRGQCTEFCGAQHARMAFDVVVMEPAAFAEWRRRQAGEAVMPAADEPRLGLQVFARAGCGSCHAVRGTDAGGRLGPDLTHMGSRLSLGAGFYPNNVGTLAGWIAGTQHLKPGARMPSYGSLPSEELRALAAYLAGLK